SNANRYIDFMSVQDHDTWFTKGAPSIIANLEWPQIKADIDAGRPVPIGLVGGVPVWPTNLAAKIDMLHHCHCVLAYGYDLDDAQNLTLWVYDPNDPLADNSTIEMSLANVAHTTPISTPRITDNIQGNTVFRAFFKHQFYLPVTPPAGVSPGPVPVPGPPMPFQSFLLQTGTALHETDFTFEFAVADWNGDGRPDLVAIKKGNTGSHSTELHVLSGASNFQNFILQTGTALHETDITFGFTLADWDGDGKLDLIAVKKANTGTHTTEVHILSGASNFQNFILQTGTALHETNQTWDFHMADWDGDGRPDLIAIKKLDTGTNSTEVHILSGAANFQNFILQTGTVLPETGSEFEFAVADWNGDGRPDLIAIKKSGTGTNSTEVHVLSGASNFQDFLLQTGTALAETDQTFSFDVTDWNGDGKLDLVAVKQSNTGTNSTEVHILSQ
ncbi:MAG: VCBS repeat-containing protein, partial [Actinomycetota bacterium]|nr:VCBS repeat-containing protein [Actinomycetota bacterium]